uniref:Ovule protein n=1 Tax=Romanomermis culicivorax TaxID=13658 RepID=A0A915JLT3_ROMCU
MVDQSTNVKSCLLENNRIYEQHPCPSSSDHHVNDFYKFYMIRSIVYHVTTKQKAQYENKTLAMIL